MRCNIIIDADPGVDDAVALALASANQDQLNILGLVTVAGNQSIERVTENALKLTCFLGMKEVPVAQGSDAPLIREVINAAHVHGSTGLGDTHLPETEKKIVSEYGVSYMAQLIRELPEGEKVTLVPLGPLTNIALLLKVFPDVKERIEEICLMGGAAVGGNVTTTGEFNIWEDPEAAQMVFTSGLPITMCGLDVTSNCGLTKEQVQQLMESKNPITAAYGEMIDFYFRSPVYHGSSVVAIHDAVTITYLLHPEWFTARKMHVEVDCSEGRNRGMTICEFREWTGGVKRVDVLMDAEYDKVAQFWMEQLTHLG